MSRLLAASAFALSLVLLPHGSFADDPPPADESQKALDAGVKAAKKGPSDVVLADQATLHVPSAMMFIPKAEANAMLVSWGNSNDDKLLGMVMPTNGEENWVATIDQTTEGYVKDDEAKNWDADGLLKTLKDGTEESNADRVKRGFQALDVVGWIEKPNYESASHRLVWSMKMVHRDVANDPNAVVNYNAYALGRDGYLEIDLLTDEQSVERNKPFAKQVLAAVEYKTGKRYEDFKPETDHIAEYGIAALVAGVAAKKLGLLALAGVFVLKFIKVIGVGVVVAGAAVKKFFFGRSRDNDNA